jgi:hypothetical protein
MAKIGRNEKCPCQSGKKYKHCCARKEASPQVASAEEQLKRTLMNGVQQLQEDAVQRRKICRELGVFFFYSTEKGDGWLLEMTDCDCIQVAKDGEALSPPIDENAETIEVNWSHMYRLENKKLILTDYRDKSELELNDAPTRELNAAMRRIRKRFSKEELDRVHLSAEEAADH